MADTGKTPILLYGSTTPTNAPSAGNLTNSSDGCEIAINVADKNLFFKDATNTVNTVPIRQSSASSNGWLSSTDWTTFNGKAPALTYTSNYVPYGQGTTTPALSANLQFDGSNFGVGGLINASYKVTISDSTAKTSTGTPMLLGTATGGSNDFNLEIKRSASGSGAYYSLQAVEQGIAYRGLVLQPSGGGVSIGNTTDPGATNLSVTGNLYLGTTSNYGRLSVVGAGTTGGTYAAAIYNSDLSKNQLLARNDGYVFLPSTAGNTTGSAANLYIDSGSGALYRSTSSIKYKTNVQDATHGLVDLLKLRPVTYEGKSEADAGKTFGGLIAEEVDAAGLTEFVQYADDGTPDALAYGNMVSLCIKAIQEQQQLIKNLQNTILQLGVK